MDFEKECQAQQQVDAKKWSEKDKEAESEMSKLITKSLRKGHDGLDISDGNRDGNGDGE